MEDWGINPVADIPESTKSVPDCLAGAVSEDAIRHLMIRSPLNQAIYKVLREHSMSNMSFDDDGTIAYPLVDLMSSPAPADIGSGEMQMVDLADAIESAVIATRAAPIAEGVTCVSEPLTEDERKAAVDKWIAPPAMNREAVEKLVQPWADYHGDLPDYDHPLRPVYESGVEYAVQLLAKELGVKEWERCDGTEEFDGDLGGTLMNIVLAAMPKDNDGDPIHPRDLLSTLSADAIRQGEGKYLVWSNEHHAWWGPDERGYTRIIERAGRYDRDKAFSISGKRGGGWQTESNPYEVAIPEADAIAQYTGPSLATPASHASDGEGA